MEGYLQKTKFSFNSGTNGLRDYCYCLRRLRSLISHVPVYSMSAKIVPEIFLMN